jgi:hypothetical protein
MMIARVPALGASKVVVAKSPTPPKAACSKVKFTADEDQRLIDLVDALGQKNWIEIAANLGGRNARQCRERFTNYLDPNLRRDEWTADEDRLLERKFAEFGPKWNKIAKFFVNRSDNALRNRWMLIARHQVRDRGLVAVRRRKPVLPIVLPILRDPAVAHTRAASEAFEILDVFRAENAFEEVDFWRELP